MAFESHDASRAVAECGTKSVFDQTIVSPRATVSSGGTKPKLPIVMTCVRGTGAAHAVTSAASAASVLRDTGRATRVITYLESEL